MLPENPLKNKRTRSAISDDVKRQICEWAETNKNAKHAEIAKYFNEKYSDLEIDRSTVSKIYHNVIDGKPLWIMKYLIKHINISQLNFRYLTML
jgi:hypothetical protein